MILTEDEIKYYILNPQNGALLKYAREISNELNMYITGEGLSEALEKMGYFCNDDTEKIRAKISRTTMALSSQILRPLEKVFSAAGGVRYYNLPESQAQEFGEMIMNDVKSGMGMPEWVQNTALLAKLIDPMSLTFDEIDEEGKCYPTYKSTSSIHDYGLNGRQPEYVIFKLNDSEISQLIEIGILPAQKEKIEAYRVVDDANEYYVERKGKDFTFHYTMANYFGYVPAKITSDKKKFNSDYYYSEFECILELTRDYYNDNSSKSLFKKFAMYPQKWSIGVKCPTCEGAGVYRGETCHKCKGSGFYSPKSVAESIIVGVNEDGKADIPTPPAGWVEVVGHNWDMMNQELDKIAIDCMDTFWGNNRQRRMQSSDVQDTALSTATGEIINERGKEPMLRSFSHWAEDIDQYHTDNIKRVEYGLNVKDSTIVYGTRYIIGTREENIDMYIKQKESNISTTLLNDKMTEIFEITYASNPLELSARKKILYVEPYPHNSINEVLEWAIPDDIKNMKLYFPLWYNTVTDLQVIVASEEELRENLLQYANQLAKKPITQPESETA